MPRGRHRHSPPLHKFLPSSAIAGVSVACAACTWFSVEPVVLRGLAVGAAVAAVVGSVVMRSWDRLAGRQVADLLRARESDAWAHEERVAELEADLDESRELRQKLEKKLRSKRAELAALRNEHASLLRRYATAETERASALEGRRLLAIEASPAGPADAAGHGPARQEAVPEPVVELTPEERLPALRRSAEAARARSATPPVSLFLRANAALELLARGTARPASETSTPQKPEATGSQEGTGQAPRLAAESGRRSSGEDDGPRVPAQAQRQVRTPSSGGTQRQAAGRRTPGQPEAGSTSGRPEAGRSGPAAGDGGETHERPAGAPQSGTRYTKAPAAAAVVAPTAPARPALGGGFDFFGNKTADVTESTAASAHNTGLADSVADGATALHKADEEAGFKPASEAERGVGQVIDLTAHDETEQLDVTGLRDAVS